MVQITDIQAADTARESGAQLVFVLKASPQRALYKSQDKEGKRIDMSRV